MVVGGGGGGEYNTVHINVADFPSTHAERQTIKPWPVKSRTLLFPSHFQFNAETCKLTHALAIKHRFRD